ncbi:MAG: EscU/YscU/HrcU family type III secretion system export apparatus switch protein [Leptospirales bacterium]|jgi:flagellar biosynthetic protein FlhB|nr:EscU/YscU/HrcU family type III secretion system export apparatus switch protein [Leptospirales bacterium]HNE23398.1 EscU/YscU/HrcU family type III secretion system export apparatus switch protein [Leptospiraceae bacterium]HNJ33261.1 EscU/YscU/HrcU family type III secretion system export apparatus switch protein [Leptospiraceae bacterium]HNL02612.1 EscU/YscU/HrcU family type III secretion system export apparatus switch protein [Leptospiraceae bacterium]HNL69406.1 EscU/YscU/HrcU family type II
MKMVHESDLDLSDPIEFEFSASLSFDFAGVDAVFSIPADALPHFHLSRFAAEDEGRTEAPTERRLREEREKGRVARSQDLTNAVVLLGAVMGLYFTGGYMVNQCMQLFHRFFSESAFAQTSFQAEDLKSFVGTLFFEVFKICMPLFGISMFMGIVGNVVQVGGLFTVRPLFMPERLTPDFTRIIPSRRNFYLLLKTLVLVGIIGFTAYMVIMDDFIPMLKSAGMDTRQALVLFAHSAFKLLIVCAVLLLALAIPDYFYERFEYMENLKMDISEVKRERKEDFGDPLVRQRQRDRYFQLTRQRNMLKEVPKADVVITNPTHYAVALLYDPAVATGPRVIAKGQDWLAFEIKRIARENDVPIEENPEVARAIYSAVEVGREIPENLYRAVSLIFAKLDKFKAVRS